MPAPQTCSIVVRFAAATLVTGLAVVPVAGQDQPSPALEVATGALTFIDDGYPTEVFVGGAGRMYLTPRVSVGPEVAFVTAGDHSHLMITGNVTFDLIGSRNGTSGVVTPFLVAGGGLFTTRSDFPTGTFTSTEGAFTAGGGVRMALGRRTFAGAEARVGWEGHIRANGLFGIAFD